MGRSSRTRKTLRGVVLVEDRRTERFVRHLLVNLGFDKHRFEFETAPSGRGDAKQWIRGRYCDEIKELRRKRREWRGLLAARDGDNDGVAVRKADLDAALAEGGQAWRGQDERVALPVPTWSIETWLLWLLGHDELNESVPLKHMFERTYSGREEREALKRAAKAWTAQQRDDDLPSLLDGRTEIRRLDLP